MSGNHHDLEDAMSSTTHALGFYQTTIGKKAVMAVTGALLFGFVIVHMIGNLQLFLGQEKLDGYAKFLHANPGLVWVARSVLLLCLGLHLLSAITLFFTNRRARPQRYHREQPQASTISSRTMIFGGVAIFTFLIYHLLHFTVGSAHHDFVAGAVYCNVVEGFSIWWVSAIYVVAQIFVGLHLYHGVWSLFQTLGLISPRWELRWRRLGAAVSILLVVGNISMPAAVLAGLLPPAGAC